MLRLIGLLALWLFCLGFALAGGWSVMWVLVYLIALLLIGGFLLPRLNLLGLELRRLRRGGRVQVGDTLVERAILESRPGVLQWWPRVWLEIEDESTLPGHRLDAVAVLGPLGRRVWEIRTVCDQRGRFTLGPVSIASGDPFGLFRATRKLAPAQSLVVYPRAVELPQVSRLPGILSGGAQRGSRVQFSTPNVSGVRDYTPGDPFNRIHWATTARTGRLMVREFELDPTADVWLVLDLHADVQAGASRESTEEYAVIAAASLAKHYLDLSRSVGLVSQNAILPTDRGTRQLERLLELLALVHATSHRSLDTLLVAETARFSRNSTLLVITPSTAESWVSFLRTLGGRGIASAAVLVEAATFSPAPSILPVVGALAAARVPSYLVKRGVPLQHALAAPNADARA